MNFVKGFVVTLGIVVFLSVAWPAIILGIGGIAVIQTLREPAHQRHRDGDEKHAAETVRITLVSYHQNGPAITAVIRNPSTARVYNLMLSCEGGPSFRNNSRWLEAGKTETREFVLKDSGPHSDCVLGYDVDVDQYSRKTEHPDSARAYEDHLSAAVTPMDNGGAVSVWGTITNYSEENISFARLKCSFTREGVDVDYLAGIPIAINPKATGSVRSSFTMNNPPNGAIFCRVVNVVTGGDTFH